LRKAKVSSTDGGIQILIHKMCLNPHFPFALAIALKKTFSGGSNSSAMSTTQVSRRRGRCCGGLGNCGGRWLSAIGFRWKGSPLGSVRQGKREWGAGTVGGNAQNHTLNPVLLSNHVGASMGATKHASPCAQAKLKTSFGACATTKNCTTSRL